MNLSAFIASMRADLARPGRTWQNPADGREMIVIPRGPARLGATRRRVVLPAFAISRHPVTNGEFLRFVAETRYTPDARHDANRPLLSHLTAADSEVLSDHPAVWVSWLDAQAYCEWAGLLLPSEVMWERAARSTDGRTFPWGEQHPSPRLATIAARQTTPTGAHPDIRTATGCEDMVGNVSEWCHPGDDPCAPLDPKVRTVPVRGSAYMRAPSWRRMAAAHPRSLSPTRRTHWVGFRPAALENH
jgi:sulfatase modifying factor 1